ncbi:MAG: hypothetical protein JF625_18875 [Inquilinus limosus]|uniref:Uncharacterized protein n=1 Tax=Inquilinus limosus TaxID=171674 RepID=A0A952FMQ4_9PROT|nr:hypothetical protein [Inquilinus limosus]
MVSDQEMPGRRGPAPTERPPGGESEGERVIERAQDISLARGPEQEGGSRWTLPILVALLAVVLILLVLALT